MKGPARKAAIAAYKERKAATGIYAVRCTNAGKAWVGRSPNLDSVQNGLWFALRMGSYPNRDLVQAWRDHGAGQFAFEVLERLDDKDEQEAYVVDLLLKERLAHWRAKLGADAI